MVSHALSLQPDEARRHNLKGNILQSLLRLDQACDAYAAALRRDDDAPYARQNLDLCRKIMEESRGRAELRPASLTALAEAMAAQGRVYEAPHHIRGQRESNELIYRIHEPILAKAGLGECFHLEHGRLKLLATGKPVPPSGNPLRLAGGIP